MRELELHQDSVLRSASAAVQRVASMQEHSRAFLSFVTVAPDLHVCITVISGPVCPAPGGGLLASAPQICLSWLSDNC